MLNWLLKYPSPDFDAGSLSFASSLSTWLLLALILIVAALLGISLWSRRAHLSAGKLWTLWALQSLIAAIVLSLIWRPTLKVETISAGENSVAVLLDSSASMQVASDNVSRFSKAQTSLTDSLIPNLKKSFNVKTGAFSESQQWTENFQGLSATGQRSNISSALLDVLDQANIDPLAAVVLASDGSDNSNAITNEFWDQLANYNIPIYTIGVGETKLSNDTEIVSVELPATATPGSVKTARVTVQHGKQPSLRVKVYSGDDIVAIEEKTVAGKEGPTTIDVTIDAAVAGVQELRFEVDSTSADISPGNNSRKRLLQVKENERKILYFEGEPRWEYKFIRRAVAKAPGISLVTILRTTPNKFYRQGIESAEQHANGFPTSKAELYQYDAVIIGNVESVSLNATQQQLLHNYVSERGGSLMMLAGDRALSDGGWHTSPVARALPVTLLKSNQPTFERAHAKVTLTSAGRHSPITQLANDNTTNETQWSELPPLADFQRLGAVKPGANVLLNAVVADNKEHALLTHQRYGNGNTYLLASSGTWRWQMQMPSEDQRHETFWRQLLTSLAAGAPQQIQAKTDRQIYNDESNLTITTKIFDNEFTPASNSIVEAVLISPSGNRTTINLNASQDEAGIYTSSADILQTGSWQIDITAKSQDGTELGFETQWIHREDGTAEQYALAQNDTLLKRIADTTGGKYFTLDRADEIAQTLLTSRSGIVREQSFPLWNIPLFFLLLIGLKLLEWFLRLYWGRL